MEVHVYPFATFNDMSLHETSDLVVCLLKFETLADEWRSFAISVSNSKLQLLYEKTTAK